MSLEEISLKEKVLVNIFTPLEIIGYQLPSIRNIFKRNSFNLFKEKIKDYNRLLKALKKYDNSEKIIKPFMRTECGRTQLKLAIKRGLLLQEEYKRIHSQVINNLYN